MNNLIASIFANNLSVTALLNITLPQGISSYFADVFYNIERQFLLTKSVLLGADPWPYMSSQLKHIQKP